MDASFICRRRVFGQGFNADAWPPISGVGNRFRHFYCCSGTTRRGHFHNLGNNCAVGRANFRYVRKATGALDRAFADGLGYFGVRSRVELWFPTGHTAHHRRRISHASPDHNGGVGRYLAAGEGRESRWFHHRLKLGWGCVRAAGNCLARLCGRLEVAFLHYRWSVVGTLGAALAEAALGPTASGPEPKSLQPFQGHRPSISIVARAHR